MGRQMPSYPLFMAAIGASGGPWLGAEQRVPFTGNLSGYVSGSASATLDTIPPGAGNGFGAAVRAPVFSSGSLVFDWYMSVCNHDGTEKLKLEGSRVPLTSGETLLIDFTDATVDQHVGSDLANNGQTIDSQAGGEYAFTFECRFLPTGLLP